MRMNLCAARSPAWDAQRAVLEPPYLVGHERSTLDDRGAVGGGAAGDRGERVGWHRPQSERWHYSEIKRREGATEKY